MWIHEQHNNLLYFISTNFVYRPQIVFTSFGNTLIKDAISKEKINLMSLTDNITENLKQINSIASIVVIENINLSIITIKHAVAKFLRLLDNTSNISFIFMFGLKDNGFKKPYTHIFHTLENIYRSKLKSIDLDNSIYIGNNAGRLETGYYKADKYDYDRAFAYNVGIKVFKTPEEAFNPNISSRTWRWKYNAIDKILNKQINLVEPSISTLHTYGVNSLKQVIIIAGPPSSGKSTLANKIHNSCININKQKNKKSRKCEIIDINNFTTRIEMYKYLNKKLSLDTNDKNNEYEFTEYGDTGFNTFIIVMPFESDQNRKLYFDIFEKTLCSVTYIDMEVSRNVCEFLNKFKVQNSKQISPDSIFFVNNYYKYYKKFNPETHMGIYVEYIIYPLVLTVTKEIKYHY